MRLSYTEHLQPAGYLHSHCPNHLRVFHEYQMAARLFEDQVGGTKSPSSFRAVSSGAIDHALAMRPDDWRPVAEGRSKAPTRPASDCRPSAATIRGAVRALALALVFLTLPARADETQPVVLDDARRAGAAWPCLSS